MLLPAFPLGTEHTKELCFRRESQVLRSEPFLSGLFSIWKIFVVWIITGHVVFQLSFFSSYYFYKLIGFMRNLHSPCMLFWSCSSIFRCLPPILPSFPIPSNPLSAEIKSIFVYFFVSICGWEHVAPVFIWHILFHSFGCRWQKLLFFSWLTLIPQYVVCHIFFICSVVDRPLVLYPSCGTYFSSTVNHANIIVYWHYFLSYTQRSQRTRLYHSSMLTFLRSVPIVYILSVLMYLITGSI